MVGLDLEQIGDLEFGIWEFTWERFDVKVGSNSKLWNND
jgi:hypothetical protein